MSKHAVEYGTQSVITMESLVPLACITSPVFARVWVAAGCWVTVTVESGVPTALTLLRVAEEVGEDSEPASGGVVLVGLAVRMLALTTCMHPFGEHSDLEGQHPPPVASEH